MNENENERRCNITVKKMNNDDDATCDVMSADADRLNLVDEFQRTESTNILLP